MLGPLALNCAAPDEGNMHLLLRAATPEQQEKYLLPLARGEARSCFAMTEPAPGAGSDPTMLQTRAEGRGDRWVLNGHKWFTSGAKGAAFAIVAAVTDPSVPAKQGATLFLVDAGTYAVFLALLASCAAFFAIRISDLLVLAVAIPTAAFLVRTFIIFHDCSHSSFLAARRANAPVIYAAAGKKYDDFQLAYALDLLRGKMTVASVTKSSNS